MELFESDIEWCFEWSLFMLKRESLGRFSKLSAMMPWTSHKLSSGTTGSKMTASQWSRITIRKAFNNPKWRGACWSVDFGYAGMLCYRPRTCGWCGDKNWFDTFCFERGFGLAESVRKVRTQTANNGAEASPSGCIAEHAGVRKRRPKLPEHCYHLWWVVDSRQVHRKAKVMFIVFFDFHGGGILRVNQK